MRDPAKDGWSPAKLKAALDFATASGSSALMVVEDCPRFPDLNSFDSSCYGSKLLKDLGFTRLPRPQFFCQTTTP